MSSPAKKIERQRAIVEIVRQQQIATQAELRDALATRGLECDQGTVSRDIRDIGLVKAVDEAGEAYYAVLDDVSPAVRVSRLSVLKQMIKELIPSGNLLVIKCGPGNAASVGEALDHLNIANIVGCVAGDNTVLAVIRDGVSAHDAADQLLKEIGQK
jgi:transcriptional regulator of arginine metabolism